MTLRKIKHTLYDLIANWFMDGLKSLPQNEIERSFDENIRFPLIAKIDVTDSEFGGASFEMPLDYPYYCVNYGEYHRFGISTQKQLDALDEAGISYKIVREYGERENDK